MARQETRRSMVGDCDKERPSKPLLFILNMEALHHMFRLS